MAKSNISKPTDAQVFATTKGQEFKTCPNCGVKIGPSQPYCYECKRLVEFKMAHTQPQFAGEGEAAQDTQEAQSFDAYRHDGFSTKQPKGTFPPTKERM